jgi:hypothetical protein
MPPLASLYVHLLKRMRHSGTLVGTALFLVGWLPGGGGILLAGHTRFSQVNTALPSGGLYCA